MITEICYQWANEVLVYRVTPEPYDKGFTFGVKSIELDDDVLGAMFEIIFHDGKIHRLNPRFMIEYTVA